MKKCLGKKLRLGIIRNGDLGWRSNLEDFWSVVRRRALLAILENGLSMCVYLFSARVGDL
jgi:hypothetical protein